MNSSALGACEKMTVGPNTSGRGCEAVKENHQSLIRYSEERDLEINSTSAERGLPGIAGGRKNWLFLGSDNGERTGAILASSVATSRRFPVNRFSHPRDVFDRANDGALVVPYVPFPKTCSHELTVDIGQLQGCTTPNGVAHERQRGKGQKNDIAVVVCVTK